MENALLYPIKFEPILKEKIWGGTKLVSNFNKKSNLQNIGESWEVSGVKENVSIVSNGFLKGVTLSEVIKKYTHLFLGTKVYNSFGNEFPLLFKFIDASDNLSIQVHPNNQLAKKRHNSFGKTEIWYVLDADENAKIYAGFNKKLNKERYVKALNSGAVLENIHAENAKKGDVYFIESGTIHAIGAGVLLAEIQQTSDITYRVYDWNRTDEKGNGRELHTEDALDALNFKETASCKLSYPNKVGVPNSIFNGQYFTINQLIISKNYHREIREIDSFVVYMCAEGEGEISTNSNIETIAKGETVLVPASCELVEFFTNTNMVLLEVFI